MNEIMRAFFPDAMKAFDAGLCIFCKKEVKEEDFTDALSVKEYGINGICQTCQDKTFTDEDD